jgi:hypothetical protein
MAGEARWLSAAGVYEIFRETPHRGESSYLYDHYKRGIQGIMKPDAKKRLALAAWQAGADTAARSLKTESSQWADNGNLQ